VGCSEGRGDGRGEGRKVGARVGSWVGLLVGLSDGRGLGTCVGLSEGCSDGSALGRGEGTCVGCCEGLGVGIGLGRGLGACVGSPVGRCVGRSVGTGDGAPSHVTATLLVPPSGSEKVNTIDVGDAVRLSLSAGFELTRLFSASAVGAPKAPALRNAAATTRVRRTMRRTRAREDRSVPVMAVDQRYPTQRPLPDAGLGWCAGVRRWR
jgi:hypothetical protein